LELPQVQDIHRIWDDERTGGREDDEDVDMDDMDNFIDYEDEEEGQEQVDEQERKRKRKEAKLLRAKAIRGTIPGVDAKCVLDLSCWVGLTNAMFSVHGMRSTRSLVTVTTMTGL
jgi:hypothetical protein